MLNFILKNKDMFSNVLACESHAILLESEDTSLTKNLATIFAMKQSCKSENKPCLICSNCLKVLNNNSLDTFIYPKEKAVLIADINEIINSLSIVPAENEYKVYIINNFDDINILQQNKLLKSIEEPPRFVKFVLTCKQKSLVLPTILSRCEVFKLPKFTSEQIEEYLKDLPGEKKQIISENSHGSLTLAEKIKTENNFFDNYNFALNLLMNFKQSKEMLKYSSELIKNKQNFIEIVKLIQYLLDDVVKINENQLKLVENKYCMNQLMVISKQYSTQACLKIIAHIAKIYDKIKFNGNLNMIVDELLLNILEEKWKNKKL